MEVGNAHARNQTNGINCLHLSSLGTCVMTLSGQISDVLPSVVRSKTDCAEFAVDRGSFSFARCENR